MNQNRANLLDKTDRLCDLISQGMTNRKILETLDIAPRTFYRCRERGRIEGSGLYKEFTSQVERSRQDYEDSVLRVIGEGLESGCTHKEISFQLGITPRTFCNWIAKGESRTRKSEFYHRIVKEIERVETERYDRIMKEVMPKLMTSPQSQRHLQALGKAEPKTTVRAVPTR